MIEIVDGVMTVKTAPAFLPLIPPKRFKGVKGGRGGGKSHFLAELLIEECYTQHIRACCGREVQNSIKDSVKQLLEDKIHNFGWDSEFRITDKEITGPNDSLIIFKGLQNHTVTSIKSLEGFNRLWLEEAQTISQKSLDLATPTFRTTGAEVWASWNPDLATDPIDRFFLENLDDPDFIMVEANYQDNPWFTDELRKDMLRDRKRDPEKYQNTWCGKYKTSSEARVFKNWMVQDFERPVGTVFRLGADWGFANDPTTLVRGSIQGNTLFIDYEAYMIGCEIVNTPDLFRRVPESDKWFITADCARPETISYMQKHGFPKINAAKKGAGSVEDGVEFLKSFDIVVHPRCEKTIEELTLYSFKIDSLTNNILPMFEDKNNHIIDAIRYMCEGIRNMKEQRKKVTVPRFEATVHGMGY